MRLKVEYLKKNLTFDDDSVGWFNKFADYLDIVKSFSEKVCCPVFSLVLDSDGISKLKFLTENLKSKTGVGRVNLENLVNDSVAKKSQELSKLNFDNNMLDSTVLIVSLLNQLPILGLDSLDDI